MITNIVRKIMSVANYTRYVRFSSNNTKTLLDMLFIPVSIDKETFSQMSISKRCEVGQIKLVSKPKNDMHSVSLHHIRWNGEHGCGLTPYLNIATVTEDEFQEYKRFNMITVGFDSKNEIAEVIFPKRMTYERVYNIPEFWKTQINNLDAVVFIPEGSTENNARTVIIGQPTGNNTFGVVKRLLVWSNQTNARVIDMKSTTAEVLTVDNDNIKWDVFKDIGSLMEYKGKVTLQQGGAHRSMTRYDRMKVSELKDLITARCARARKAQLVAVLELMTKQ